MKLKSSYFYNTVYDIDYKNLKEIGIDTLIFDIDNTLASYDSLYPDKKLLNLFSELKKDGFKLYLLSNNNKKRVKTFSEKANLPYKSRALKPFKFNILRAIKFLGSKKSRTVLIGDQIFTDIWGANRVGIKSVLVNPISSKEDKFVAFKRRFERLVNKK